jgi:hypothetical protein
LLHGFVVFLMIAEIFNRAWLDLHKMRSKTQGF